MLGSFLTFIKTKRLFEAHQRVLLTVSGGMDSVAMAQLFAEAGFGFGVAHCNFQLRSAESDQDEEFVRELAKKYKVDFFVKRFNTKQFAKEKGISTQMAARELRYEWFEQIRLQNGYDFIATAHHQDDNLETILLNLCRGTGLAGLHGILPKNSTIIRPLLFGSRHDLEQFVKEKNLTWREDSSNQSDGYQRNLLRHKVLPVLKSINPAVSETAFRLSERVGESEKIIAESIENLRNEVVVVCQTHIEVYYEKIEFVEQLYHLLRPYGFQYNQNIAIFNLRDAETGKQYFSETHLLTKDRQKFIITPLISSQEQVPELVISTIQNSGQQLSEKQNYEAFFDQEAVQFPLKLRKWTAGDWFCPAGMGGKRKKISDFLIDIKVPRPLKSQVHVLESDSKIMWVVGYRADERFKIKDETNTILRITASKL